MKNRKYVKILSLCLLITLIFGQVFAANVQKYQDELDAIKEQEKQNANNLSGVEKELAQDMYEMLDLDSKMMKYSNELADLQAKVDTVNAKLKDQEDALQNASQGYNAAEDMYLTRLRAIYENGVPSIIDILFASKGITDFFSRMNVYTSILEYDKSLVGNMQSQKEYVDYIKKDIEVQKLQLEQLKYDTEKSTQALEDTVNAKNKKIADLQSSKTDLQEKAKILEQQRDAANKKVEEELEKAYRESLANSNNPVFTGGDFAWPVNGYYTITTKYNAIYDPFSSGKDYVHYGADIAGSGISGKPILAIEAGTVTVPAFMASGYGNYVIVAHGKSAKDGYVYTSLYGHMSSIAVTTGQHVERGQVIGYVGSTGWSTGPHLHFQMTRNGATFDPLTLYPAVKFNYV